MQTVVLQVLWVEIQISNDEREIFNRSINFNKCKSSRFRLERMQTHIENLWEEVGFKNEKINDLHFEKAELNEKFKELYKKLYEMEVRKSSAEKSMTEFFGDRTDN